MNKNYSSKCSCTVNWNFFVMQWNTANNFSKWIFKSNINISYFADWISKIFLLHFILTLIYNSVLINTLYYTKSVSPWWNWGIKQYHSARWKLTFCLRNYLVSKIEGNLNYNLERRNIIFTTSAKLSFSLTKG